MMDVQGETFPIRQFPVIFEKSVFIAEIMIEDHKHPIVRMADEILSQPVEDSDGFFDITAHDDGSVDVKLEKIRNAQRPAVRMILTVITGVDR